MSEDWLWWRDGVVYQIYPRSFADSNHDGIGDLKGITAHLDYLEDLGVDAVWLSPIYPSPNVDFGYDVADYKAVDPRFGTMEDLLELIQEAHRRKIHIILDLVLNHSSDQHPWFKESRSSRDNAYRDWYLWKDPAPGGGAPNNWQSVFGGPAWEYDSTTKQYYYHMFYKEQPDFNWRNPDVRRELLDVFRFWLERGVDGFRLDVFNLYFKQQDFPNNPSQPGIRAFDRQRHPYEQDQPEMMPLLAEIRAMLDAFGERYAVGETFQSDHDPEKAAQYVGKDRLHAAFSFEFTKRPWKAGQMLDAVQRWEHALDEDAWPNYVLCNHDVPRSASRFTRGEGDERLKVAAALLLTLRGTPFLYYGEEIGMRDIHVSRSQIQDPVGKRFWPLYKGRDGCRAPMQWNGSANAGFSDTTPWLPVHPDYLVRSVEQQQKDSQSLYHFYRSLLHLRREIPALQKGMMIPLTHEPKPILAYLRQTSQQTVLVMLNFTGKPAQLYLSSALANRKWKLLLSTSRDTAPAVQAHHFSLKPNEACILIEE